MVPINLQLKRSPHVNIFSTFLHEPMWLSDSAPETLKGVEPWNPISR